MDWFDDYLNALTDPGRTVNYPPDTYTWRPARPNQQQKRMINDSMAFDQQQQMKMIQEARHELEEHTHGHMSHADVAEGIGADPGSPAAPIVAETVSLYYNVDPGQYVYAYVYTSTGYAFVQYWDGTSEVIGSGVPGDELYFEHYIAPDDPYAAPRLVQVTSCDVNGGI